MPLKVSGTELAFHYTEDVAAAFKSWSQTNDTHASRKLQYFAFSEYNM